MPTDTRSLENLPGGTAGGGGWKGPQEAVLGHARDGEGVPARAGGGASQAGGTTRTKGWRWKPTNPEPEGVGCYWTRRGECSAQTKVDQNTRPQEQSSILGHRPAPYVPSHGNCPPQTAGLFLRGGACPRVSHAGEQNCFEKETEAEGGPLSAPRSPSLLPHFPLPGVTSSWELVEGRGRPLKRRDPPMPAGLHSVPCGCAGSTGFTPLYELSPRWEFLPLLFQPRILAAKARCCVSGAGMYVQDCRDSIKG